MLLVNTYFPRVIEQVNSPCLLLGRLQWALGEVWDKHYLPKDPGVGVESFTTAVGLIPDGSAWAGAWAVETRVLRPGRASEPMGPLRSRGPKGPLVPMGFL